MATPEDDIIGPWDKLEIRDDGRLYFDGSPVKTSLELQGWTLFAALMGGVGAIASAIFAALTYMYPPKLQTSLAASSSIPLATAPALPNPAGSYVGPASTKIEVEEPSCPKKKR